MKTRTLAVVVVAVALSGTLSGHHSFPAYYFEMSCTCGEARAATPPTTAST